MGFSTVLGGGPATSQVGSAGTGVVPARSYSGSSVTVDRSTVDLSELIGAGWVILANHKGTTAQRPAIDELSQPISPGFRYLDTTLSKIVVRGASGWIDATTGAPA